MFQLHRFSRLPKPKNGSYRINISQKRFIYSDLFINYYKNNFNFIHERNNNLYEYKYLTGISKHSYWRDNLHAHPTDIKMIDDIREFTTDEVRKQIQNIYVERLCEKIENPIKQKLFEGKKINNDDVEKLLNNIDRHLESLHHKSNNMNIKKEKLIDIKNDVKHKIKNSVKKMKMNMKLIMDNLLIILWLMSILLIFMAIFIITYMIIDIVFNDILSKWIQ